MSKLPKYGQAPDNITALAPDEVFVFGSNLRGVHGAGAAKFAVEHFGAAPGNGIGPQGSCYALPTKNFDIQTLSLEAIAEHVEEALTLMEDTYWMKFLFTAIGTGLAGYKSWDISRLFYVKSDGTLRKELSNVYLPKQFLEQGCVFQGEYMLKLSGYDISTADGEMKAVRAALSCMRGSWDTRNFRLPPSIFTGWLKAFAEGTL